MLRLFFIYFLCRTQVNLPKPCQSWSDEWKHRTNCGWTPRFKCGWIIHTGSTATFARTATAFDHFTQCWGWYLIGKSINLACFISITLSTLKSRRPMVAFLHLLHWESTCHPPRNDHHAYNVLRQRKKDWCCFSHVIWSVLLANF